MSSDSGDLKFVAGVGVGAGAVGLLWLVARAFGGRSAAPARPAQFSTFPSVTEAVPSVPSQQSGTAWPPNPSVGPNMLPPNSTVYSESMINLPYR